MRSPLSSSPRHRLGLVVGKFAPLHRGHELVIETALARCDALRIISYAKPELPGCSPSTRRSWLAARFPEARVLVLDESTLRGIPNAPAWPPDDADATLHRRFVGWLCHDLLAERVDAVFTSEDYGPGFAAELERYYQEQDRARATRRGARDARHRISHVAVDPARSRLPISASRIRADVHAARHWLAPEVYASFVERVVLLGGESSGKSTLAGSLATRFSSLHVGEVGREWWEARGGALAFDDLLLIAERQVEREEATLGAANRYLFCDTSPLTTLLYSEVMFGRVHPKLSALAQRPYAHSFVCAPDFPFVQDGTRRDDAFRQSQHARTLRELEQRNVPFQLLEGPVEARVRHVEAVLRR